MQDMAKNSGTRTIFFPHSPGSVQDTWQQMAMGAISAAEPENQKTEAGGEIGNGVPLVSEKRRKG